MNTIFNLMKRRYLFIFYINVYLACLDILLEHTHKINRQNGFKNDQTLCFHYDLAYCHTFLRETYILTKHSNDEHHLYENEVLYEN